VHEKSLRGLLAYQIDITQQCRQPEPGANCVVCSPGREHGQSAILVRQATEPDQMEGAELAVIGASGDIGREIVAEVLRERLLAPTGRVQLVGRPDGQGAGKLLGLVSDLTDAHAEVAPSGGS